MMCVLEDCLGRAGQIMGKDVSLNAEPHGVASYMESSWN